MCKLYTRVGLHTALWLLQATVYRFRRFQTARKQINKTVRYQLTQKNMRTGHSHHTIASLRIIVEILQFAN